MVMATVEQVDDTELAGPPEGKFALEDFDVDQYYQEGGVRLLLHIPGGESNGVWVGISAYNTRESLIDLSEVGKSSKTHPQGKNPTILAMIQTATDFKFYISCVSGQVQWWNYELFYSPSDSDIIVRNISGKSLAMYPINGSPNHERLDTGNTKRLTVGVWHLELSSALVMDIRVLQKPSLTIRSAKTESTKHPSLPESRDGSTRRDSSDSNSTDEDIVMVSQLFDIREGQTAEFPALWNSAAYEITKTKPIALQSIAEVFLASHSHYGSSIAVKVMRTERSAENNGRLIQLIENFARECHIHESLQHPSIVQLLDFDARFLSAYLEYFPGTDLSRPSWRDENGFCGANREEAMEVWKQIADALSFVHHRNISHNDIKPANLLAHGNGQALKATLCDFGLSLYAFEGPFNGGTRWYIPAEHISTGQRGKSGDIWAFGVSILFVLGHIPLPEMRNNHFRSDYVFWRISETRTSTSSAFWRSYSVVAADVKVLGAAEKMMSWIREITAVLASLTPETEPCLDILQGMLAENPNHRLTAPQLVEKLRLHNGTSERSEQTEAKA